MTTLPAWIPADAWAGYVEMRVAIKKPLTLELVKEHVAYDPDSGIFTRLKPVNGKKVGDRADIHVKGRRASAGYRQVGFARHCILAHRLAWFYMHGAMPDGQIDHIDGDPSNNKLANLRVLTNAENCQNRRKPTRANKTGFLGVVQNRNRYSAFIKKNYKSISLGTFSTPEQAHEAYLAAKREMHPYGEVAK